MCGSMQLRARRGQLLEGDGVADRRLIATFRAAWVAVVARRPIALRPQTAQGNRDLSLQGQWPRFFLFASAVCALELALPAAAQDEIAAAAQENELWQRDDAPPSDRSIGD